MHKIFETDFYKNLIKNPKVVSVPYMVTYGPIITKENISKLLEQLMVEYLITKNLIIENYKDYNSTRTDLEQLNEFEKELNNRIGKQQLKMEFLVINPSYDIQKQFKNILQLKNFECFLI